MRLVRCLLPVLLVGFLAETSVAQFDLFSWDFVPHQAARGYGTVTADSMTVGAGFEGPLGFQGFMTRTPVAGTVAVTIESYMTWDGVCNLSVPVFAHNGAFTTLASCSIFDASFVFDVAAGDGFGLGLKSSSPFYPGEVHFIEFSFTPSSGFAYWTDLGQALGGALGPPQLSGQGLLHGGMPIELHVTNAPPNQPATLVVGVSALGAPFKGGVMVPTPNLVLPAGLVGMGTLDLAGVWPTNLPPGVQLWMQVWIVDPSAPLGFSATNGVLAATP